eukprot:6741207-Pyramimonas_sp.AAC.1
MCIRDRAHTATPMRRPWPEALRRHPSGYPACCSSRSLLPPPFASATQRLRGARVPGAGGHLACQAHPG